MTRISSKYSTGILGKIKNRVHNLSFKSRIEMNSGLALLNYLEKVAAWKFGGLNHSNRLKLWRKKLISTRGNLFLFYIPQKFRKYLRSSNSVRYTENIDFFNLKSDKDLLSELLPDYSSHKLAIIHIVRNNPTLESAVNDYPEINDIYDKTHNEHCVICHDPLHLKTKDLVVLDCGHIFHNSCLLLSKRVAPN
eukprot:NODE_838_length_3795_cov_0.380952.p2 type:complete len:193 gc:universal NODE_838_length_3795_cov_0.380952:1216-638(-)